MRSSLVLVLSAALVTVGCGEEPVAEEASTEWAELLERQPADSGVFRSGEERQAWTDELRAFIERHPDHAEARERYDQLELEHALQLVANGRLGEARLHLESILKRDPSNGTARDSLDRVQRLLERDRESFESLRSGLTQAEVRDRVGLPAPGWQRVHRGREEWIYRTREGETAVLTFEDELLSSVEVTSASD